MNERQLARLARIYEALGDPPTPTDPAGRDPDQSAIAEIRHAAADLAELIVTRCAESRETSLALTELESAIQWSDRAIRLHHAR